MAAPAPDDSSLFFSDLDLHVYCIRNCFFYPVLKRLNPPGPDTFFASDFNDFFICCSYDTPEKGLVEKQFFGGPEVHFSGVAKKRLLRCYS